MFNSSFTLYYLDHVLLYQLLDIIVITNFAYCWFRWY